MNDKAWQLHVENLRLRHELKLLRNELNRERLRADLATARLREPPPVIHAPPLPKRYPRTTPRGNYNQKLTQTQPVSHHAHQPSERMTMETEPTTPTEPEPTDPTPDDGGEDGDNE